MEKADNYGRTVTIKIKSSDFKIITRSRSFQQEVRQLTDLVQITHDLLENNQQEIEKVRLLGVSVSNLMREHDGLGIQLEFDF
jgi:DNA polymerase-4